MLYIYTAIITFSPYLAFLPMLFMGFRILQDGEMIIKNDWNSGLLFLFAWGFFVGIINMDGISALASFAFLFYFFVSVYIQNNYNTEEKVEKLLKIIIYFSIFSAIIGVFERFTPLHNESSWWKQLFGIYPQVLFYDKFRISGTFGNPNVAGTWYSAMIMICFYLFQKSSGKSRMFYGFSLFLFTSVLVMTGSRGATIGLIMALGTYAYFMGNGKNMKYLMLGLVIIATFMLISPYIFPRGKDLGSSIADRESIWLNCLNMFKLKPFTGWGILGIYFADSTVYQYIRTFHGHNLWITMGTTLGVVGLGVFIYLQCHIMDQLLVLRENKCKLTPMLAGLQALIIGQGLIDFTIMNPQGGIIFFGCSAIISALALQYSMWPVEEYSSLLVKSVKKWNNY